jgi:glycosyltransferase involved in cell wall biosynthesis
VKVLLTVGSFLPSYGGPAFSVSLLASALADLGADVGVWAPDQSAEQSPLFSPRTSVRRLSGPISEVLQRFGPADVLHDNGIWLPHNHRLVRLAARAGAARIVSIRGMLQPWALKHKHTRKKAAWWLYQRGDLERADLHHCTSDAEAGHVRDCGLGVPLVTIPNGVELPSVISSREAFKGEPRVALFLGRIYPVKGLPMLIEAWARTRPQGWILRIAGPDEAGHRREVERAVADADLRDVVHFTGPIAPQMKQDCFSKADLFVLPTHSESFGVVIAEALAHGVPVLTTSGAPWSILPKVGCGWWVDANVDGIASGLRAATSLDSETLRALGAKGRDLVALEFSWKSVAQRTLSAYSGMLKPNNRFHADIGSEVA